MSKNTSPRPVATSGVDPSEGDDDFTPQPVPAQVREHFADVGREMAAKHAVEGMPEPTLIVLDEPLAAELRREYERGRTEMLTELTKRLPQNVEQAAAQAHASLLRWQGLADEALRAERDVAKHDELGGAVRQRCVEQLMRDVHDATQLDGDPVVVRKGLSASSAKDAASNHPTYVEHKLRLAELRMQRDEAVVRRDSAYEALQNAREYLKQWRVRNEGGVVGRFLAALNNAAKPLDPAALFDALAEEARKRAMATHGTSVPARETLGDLVQRTGGIGLDGRAPR